MFGYAVVKLSDIATITRGGNFQKKDFCEEGVPCIHYGQIYTYYGTSASKTITMITQTAADKLIREQSASGQRKKQLTIF